MYDIFPGEVDVSLDNLLHKATGLVLGKFVLDEFIQICIAELRNDVGVVFGCKYFVHVENVLLVFEFFQDRDFALEQDSIDFIFEQSHVDDFDGNFLVGVIIAAGVDLAGVTLADDISESIRVVLYFLAGERGGHSFSGNYYAE